MKIKIIAFLLFVSIPLFSENDNLQFKWGFYFKDYTKSKFHDRDGIVTISSDNKFKILLNQEKNGFLYVYFLENTGNIFFIFPKSSSFYETNNSTGDLFLPSNEEWFFLENNLNARMIFIYSKIRLTALEEKSNNYLVALKNNKNKEELELFSDKLISDIMEIARRSNSLKLYYEKPVTETKVLEEEIQKYYYLVVEKQELYVRIIKFQVK